jgi:hypothetical protein
MLRRKVIERDFPHIVILRHPSTKGMVRMRKAQEWDGPHGPQAILVCSSREVIDREMIFMRTMRTMRTKGNKEGKK